MYDCQRSCSTLAKGLKARMKSYTAVPGSLRGGGQRLLDFHITFAIFCFIMSSTIFLLLAFLPPSDRVCIARSVTYERVTEAIRYEWVNFGDYFYPPSVYRHHSPQQDLEWQELMSHDVIGVAESELSGLNQSKVAPWKQLADGSFAAVIGVHHQMNCLNLLRRHVHMELENHSRTRLREDVDQCINLLRYQLMCSADITPFLELRVPTFAGSKPDLQTKHKCRKYDDLKEWAMKNSKGKFSAKWDPVG